MKKKLPVCLSNLNIFVETTYRSSILFVFCVTLHSGKFKAFSLNQIFNTFGGKLFIFCVQYLKGQHYNLKLKKAQTKCI